MTSESKVIAFQKFLPKPHGITYQEETPLAPIRQHLPLSPRSLVRITTGVFTFFCFNAKIPVFIFITVLRNNVMSTSLRVSLPPSWSQGLPDVNSIIKDELSTVESCHRVKEVSEKSCQIPSLALGRKVSERHTKVWHKKKRFPKWFLPLSTLRKHLP